jgi:hypothetical protein
VHSCLDSDHDDNAINIRSEVQKRIIIIEGNDVSLKEKTCIWLIDTNQQMLPTTINVEP